MDDTRPDLIVDEWLRHAADDEHHASADLRHRDASPAGVCFLGQQMAEKLLKALLVARANEYEKTHDLNKLMTLIVPHVPGIAEAIREHIIILDPHYVGIRYPADVPIESYTWNDAEEAFAAALAIKQFVLGALGRGDGTSNTAA